MDGYLTFFASAIEALTVYWIMKLLDNQNGMPVFKVLLYALLVGIGVTIADAMELPFQFVFTFINYSLLLIILLKRNILILFMDLMVSYGLYVFIQLLSSIIIGHFHGNILHNKILLFVMLVLYASIFCFASNIKRISKHISSFYTINRDIIMWISVNIFFTIVIVLHLWTDLDDYFWKEQWNILLLILIIYILNGILLFSFLLKKKQKEKMQAYQEYGQYLEEMMHQLSSRQHEFANQINVMVGLAQIKKGEELSKAIIDYGERILDEKKRKSRETIICNDSMISAMLYRKMTEADNAKIQFDYLIEKPFPKFSASAYDLVELLVNLINNAFEAVLTLKEEDRQVFLKINSGKIEVLNTVPASFEDASITKFSDIGYSTKGKHRGYGVSNIKTIIKRYKGTLEIYRQDSMIVFSILLP